MKLLALDTATEACSAALWLDGEVRERYSVPGRGHAERLLPMVDELLAEAGLPLGACDAIAFGRGPGAFTGVRIAVALAQGLALGVDRPLLPVSDLAALAWGALAAHPADAALACLDARMGEVYWAEASRGPEGLLLRREALGRPESVTAQGLRLVGAGHGWSAYPELAERHAGRLVSVLPELLPRASWIAALAAIDAAAGRWVDPALAAPVYLRDDVATRSSRAPGPGGSRSPGG